MKPHTGLGMVIRTQKRMKGAGHLESGNFYGNAWSLTGFTGIYLL